MPTWLITGCSTGLGWAPAEAVLDAGHDGRLLRCGDVSQRAHDLP